MFDSIGWFEILALLVIGLLVIGPERLPRVIEDVRAAIYAARSAIDRAKKEMSGEFGEEFHSLQKPLEDLATLQRMGPKAAIAKTLLDGDTTIFDAFDPQKIMNGTTAGQAVRDQAASRGVSVDAAAHTPRVDNPATATPPHDVVPPAAGTPPRPTAGGAPSAWEDIT